MKALKEKRNSLRSLWRRSLVILSILALVFAVACGSKTDPTTPTDPTNPTDPGTPTQPPAKVATSINVIYDPTAISYAGIRPDLTGIKAEVWFSDNSFEIVTDSAQFIPEPAFLPMEAINLWPSSTGTNGASILPVGVKPVQVRVFHVSGGTASAPVNLPIVWGTSTSLNDTKANALLNGDPIHFIGTMTQQGYFEDDFPNFAGITAEARYEGYNLKPDSTSFAAEINLATTFPIDANTGAVINVAGTPTYRENPHSTLKDAVNKDFPAKRVAIELTQAHVDTEHGIYGTGINGDKKTVRIKFAGKPYTFPFTSFYPIRGIEVANLGSLNFGDYYQWDTTAVDWIEELFGKAGLRLKVYYSGIDQTREIGLKEFRRANALKWKTTPDPLDISIPAALNNQPVARMVDPPYRYTEDLDTVVARFGYFSKQVIYPTGTESVPFDTFPNQVIDLNVPLWEFTGDIRFDRRPLMPEIPLYVDGFNTNGSGENPGPAAHATDNAPTVGLVNQIRQTYQLVAVYNRADKPNEEKVKDISNMIWRSDAPNAYTSKTGAGTNWWTSETYINDTVEIIEVDLSFTIPSGALTTDRLHTAVAGDGTPYALGSGIELHEATALTKGVRKAADVELARRQFAGLSADLEPAIVILPYHKP